MEYSNILFSEFYTFFRKIAICSIWAPCAAVRANTTSSMGDHTKEQLNQADQHAAILTTNPTTAAVWSSNVRPVHHQQAADSQLKQLSQLIWR